MRYVFALLFTVALSGAAKAVVADEKDARVEAPELQVEMDRALLHLLTSPDGFFIRALHENSEEELLSNLGITTDQNGVPIGRFPRKALVFHKAYKSGAKRRHVFIYDPCRHSWPGTQPETIVITDPSHCVLDWKEVGGSPMFVAAAFQHLEDAGPVLSITRQHRHTIPNPKRGIYRFRLKNDTITPSPKIEWLYKDEAERTQYARWRKALRERERANGKTADEQTDEREPE
jgi:hypothetical protein